MWQDFEKRLGISYPKLNDQYAVNTAALGIGSIILIPLALKFGRRPIYLFTALVVCITAIWQAVLRDFKNMVTVQVFNGFACAVSWTLVPITVCILSTCQKLSALLIRVKTIDLFFVHQRGRMNAIYQLMINVGVGSYIYFPLIRHGDVDTDYAWIGLPRPNCCRLYCKCTRLAMDLLVDCYFPWCELGPLCILLRGDQVQPFKHCHRKPTQS